MLNHEFYTNTIKSVAHGSTFTINLNEKNLRINGKYIIKNGQFCPKKDGTPSVFSSCAAEMFSNKTTEDVRTDIRALYDEYKYSRPTERSGRKQRTAFRALSYDELPDEALYGEPRDVAQCAIELYILLLAMSKRLEWAEFATNPKHHFYKDELDGDLIIMKDWIIVA